MADDDERAVGPAVPGSGAPDVAPDGRAAAEPDGEATTGDGPAEDVPTEADGAPADVEDTPTEVDDTPADVEDTPAEADDVAPQERAPTPEPHVGHGRHERPAPGDAPPGGWTGLFRALRPHRSRAQVLAGLLCGVLGFALVVQVSANQGDDLSTLRQSELVPLLDDVTQRSELLESQVRDLESTRDELRSGAAGKQAALDLAEEQATTEGILAGRLPAKGPGVDVTVIESGEKIPAATMFNILEELRNAGAEVVEINGVRIVASSYFERVDGDLVVDGTKISSPYRWKAIGDPPTLETALQIVGGAMAAVRNKGAQDTIRQLDEVEIDSTRTPTDPQFATPVPDPAGS
ncbi:DUF881 domain-containing protein [Cellulomonas sp. PhB143]|uniref:DUF881 domain-containing protein n=1 Tax=Cellulomonas sp. PhB143 TaxID=2485186 RepID=UPI000F491A9A|nr:DUF881 domain-containing protein [Cellulomonas sp. PhB143]ROS74506.1 uncharacterized protein YlxW (UPF0749 family) [Cellulomonas sp. PhB143]